ncbi:hypothetical protein ROZALSC1DRAFT_25044 [Rozella allomycis CSF55]|uniref:Uncharacterized protein n=1 Tax=Rozella allomycis (strain CSF55) TaxID=988480 RepID=A0A4P9YBK4_ROZAC|nr:hypothetical protein ROZALSC1DRAFT_25044 [Rozella allomycis CSF55]
MYVRGIILPIDIANVTIRKQIPTMNDAKKTPFTRLTCCVIVMTVSRSISETMRRFSFFSSVETFGLCLNCKDCTTTPLTITVRDVAAAKSLLDIVTKSNDFLIDSVRDLPSIPGLPREEQSKMHKVIVAMLNYFLKEYQNENIFISKTAMTRQFRRVGSEDIARIISKLANIGLCSAFKKSGRGRELVVEVNGIIETIGNFSDFVKKEFSEYR